MHRVLCVKCFQEDEQQPTGQNRTDAHKTSRQHNIVLTSTAV
jgi:hypothetical protein